MRWVVDVGLETSVDVKVVTGWVEMGLGLVMVVVWRSARGQ